MRAQDTEKRPRGRPKKTGTATTVSPKVIGSSQFDNVLGIRITAGSSSALRQLLFIVSTSLVPGKPGLKTCFLKLSFVGYLGSKLKT